MAYRRGDKPIPKFKAPRLPRPPEGPPARGAGRVPGTKPDAGRPPTRPPTTSPKPPSGKPPAKPPSPEDDPYGAYIGELRKLKEEEIARQQKEAERIRQAYANYAAWLGALPGQIQSLYSNAAGDQAQFANGFSQGLRDAAAESAAEVNKMLADIGAPAGQQIAASQGDQAGNVLYGVGGYIPAQALTTSGAAFGSAAAFMGPNAIKSGLLESQKYLTDNAKNLSDYDLEIAKLVGEQSKYRADQKAAKAKALHDDAVDLYNNGLITQREFARRLGLPNWKRYPNAPKPGEAAGIDASASKLVGFLVDDNGNLIKDRKGKPIPIKEEPQDLDPTVRSVGGFLYQYDPVTGRWIKVAGPGPRGRSPKNPLVREVNGNLYQWDPVTKSWIPAPGAPTKSETFDENAMAKANNAARVARWGVGESDPYTGKRTWKVPPIKNWDAAVDYVMSQDQDITRAMAEWALWRYRRKLKGAPKKAPPNPKASAAQGGGDYSRVPTGLTPSGFRPLAIQIANKYGIPVGIFLSLIEHESHWDPNAVSSAGAVGLGQLMPGTSGVKNRRDPLANLDGSARYLIAQYRRFKSWDLALAAYNAGPNAVAKYGGIPPYKETQAYVRNVLATASSGSGSPKSGNVSFPLRTSPGSGSEFSYVDPEGAPDANGTRHHAAKDWFAPGGSGVFAPEGGTVVEVKRSRDNSGQVFGGVIKVQTADGRVWVFRHVNPYAFRKGQSVAAGQKIAAVTRWADAPSKSHAHIELWKSLRGGYRYENMLDPMDWFARYV